MINSSLSQPILIADHQFIPGDIFQTPTVGQAHDILQFAIDLLRIDICAILTAAVNRHHIRSADTDRFSAECQHFKDILARAHTAIGEDFDRTANSFADISTTSQGVFLQPIAADWRSDRKRRFHI
jgi:hypothetical protein